MAVEGGQTQVDFFYFKYSGKKKSGEMFNSEDFHLLFLAAFPPRELATWRPSWLVKEEVTSLTLLTWTRDEG
jgi:hypothetical protein